jgi:large subunit ribosomal protein L5
MSYQPRLQAQYQEQLVPALKERFEYTSVMQVPRITKICLNQGLGKAIADKKIIESVIDEMICITG